MDVPSITIAAGDWQCPYCSFHRTFGTKQGCLDGAGKHLLQKHNKRVWLPRVQPVGVYEYYEYIPGLRAQVR